MGIWLSGTKADLAISAMIMLCSVTAGCWLYSLGSYDSWQNILANFVVSAATFQLVAAVRRFRAARMGQN